jgi:dTMP kinase
MVRTYGIRLPGMPRKELPGHLIVVEGADGSGRTTEVELLRDWLEIQGHPVVDTGLRRSTLVSRPIDRAKQGHTLGATTMALFYAADFADQLENKILPALAAGCTVLADRYTYTLMARAIVRGASREWAQKLYAFALEPDLIVFLEARTEILLHRAIAKYGSLDYWESGMDLSLARDRFESFFRYQDLLRREFDWMQTTYGFRRVDANRTPLQVHRDVKALVAPVFGKRVRLEVGTEVEPRPSTSREVSGLGSAIAGDI